MNPQSRTRIAAELAGFETLLEVGVGRRFEVAAALAARGCNVTAIDVVEREPPAGVRFRRADVLELASAAGSSATEPPSEDPSVADPAAALGIDAPVDAVYALNLPAELQRPTVELAARLDAACVFTTLGFEEPVVPVRRHAIDGETLYVARGTLNA